MTAPSRTAARARAPRDPLRRKRRCSVAGSGPRRCFLPGTRTHVRITAHAHVTRGCHPPPPLPSHLLFLLLLQRRRRRSLAGRRCFLPEGARGGWFRCVRSLLYSTPLCSGCRDAERGTRTPQQKPCHITPKPRPIIPKYVPGLTSRCTAPAECLYSSAAAICNLNFPNKVAPVKIRNPNLETRIPETRRTYPA